MRLLCDARNVTGEIFSLLYVKGSAKDRLGNLADLFGVLGWAEQAFQFCFDLLNLWGRAGRVFRDSRAVSGVVTREEPR